MKHLILLLTTIILITSCSEDCGESFGNVVKKEIEVDTFNEIIVNTGVSLYLKQGDTQKLIIETGENRQDNVHLNVENDVLSMQADNTCVLSASYEPVKIYITAPNITKIRNSSEYTIHSEGILHYPNLILISEDHNSDFINTGDFELTVANHSIKVISNGLSNIEVKGNTLSLSLHYFNGVGMFKGKDLLANTVFIHHRAENTLFVNPQESLKGNIYSIGNVVSYNHPTTVEITEHYEGKLIYQD